MENMTCHWPLFSNRATSNYNGDDVRGIQILVSSKLTGIIKYLQKLLSVNHAWPRILEFIESTQYLPWN